MDAVRGYRRVLGQATTAGDAIEDALAAAILLSRCARGAVAAPDQGLDCHQRAGDQIDAHADCVERPADLVSGQQARGRRKRTAEEVEIGTADASRGHAHAYPTGARFWYRPIDDLERAIASPHRGFHHIYTTRAPRKSGPTRGGQMATYILISSLTDEGR